MPTERTPGKPCLQGPLGGGRKQGNLSCCPLCPKHVLPSHSYLGFGSKYKFVLLPRSEGPTLLMSRPLPAPGGCAVREACPPFPSASESPLVSPANPSPKCAAPPSRAEPPAQPLLLFSRHVFIEHLLHAGVKQGVRHGAHPPVPVAEERLGRGHPVPGGHTQGPLHE